MNTNTDSKFNHGQEPFSARLRLQPQSAETRTWQSARLEELPPVFSGNKHGAATYLGRCPGAIAKEKLVASRTGLTSTLPRQIAGSAQPELRLGKRCFPNTPLMQSVVDQVVFGRDMDASGADQFDEEFMGMYEGAGLSSQELSRLAMQQGIKSFQNIPTMQSVVDQVVFGRDMDFSGEDKFDSSFYSMYEGAAGKPTIAANQSLEPHKV